MASSSIIFSFAAKKKSMKKYELDILAELLSDKVADKVLKRLGKVPVDAQDEMVDSKEAARMIGVSPAYMRQLKDRIPHVKAGQHKQGRILFRKADVISAFIK